MQPRDANLKLVRGAWPTDIAGYYFVSSPAPQYKGRHIFFADGTLYRLSLKPGEFGAAPDAFAFRHGILANPSHRLRQKVPHVFRPTLLGVASPFGNTNTANTAQLPWGDRLLVTGDVGRPVEVCPVSLAFLAEVGHRKQWLDSAPIFPVLPVVTSPAHPVADPERACIWTADYNMMTQRVGVVRYDGGKEIKRWPLKGAVMRQTMHTISQTRDWVLLMENGMRVDMAEMSGAPRKVTTFKEAPLYLVRKADIERTPPGEPVPFKTIMIAPECMHFYAIYDDSDGIKVFFEHSTDSDIAVAVAPGDKDIWGRPIDPVLEGMYGLALSPPSVTLRVLDPETCTSNQIASYENPEYLWNVQTSAMDWSRKGLERPTLHHVMYNGFRPEGLTQRQLALYEDRIDKSRLPNEETPPCLASFDWQRSLEPRGLYRFRNDEWATSPTFVPRHAGVHGDPYEGAEVGGHDGYIIVVVQSEEGFRIELFDANKVSAGPVAVLAEAGHRVPFVIHSSWMPRIKPAARLDRLRFSEELDEARLKTLAPELAEVARKVGRELDEELGYA
jgi:carotenoid cleavage dioxygenase-like enzyme